MLAPDMGPAPQPCVPSAPPWQVHHILQEMVIGGMVLETNMNEIVAQVEAQGKLEKAEVSGELELTDPGLPGGWPWGQGWAWGMSRVFPVSACLNPGDGTGDIPAQSGLQGAARVWKWFFCQG